MRSLLTLMLMLWTATAMAMPNTGARFASIDGGTFSLSAWKGQPILVVNTASLCGFTGQYDGLQDLYDAYRAQGLVVVAVPSNDFKQELGSASEVKQFCEMNFDIDLPMADITHVRGAEAHPFYAWLRDDHGFVPRWNFNKVLLDGEGDLVATYGSAVRPDAPKLIRAIEALLVD